MYNLVMEEGEEETRISQEDTADLEKTQVNRFIEGDTLPGEPGDETEESPVDKKGFNPIIANDLLNEERQRQSNRPKDPQ